jgi:hypothetical protein
MKDQEELAMKELSIIRVDLGRVEKRDSRGGQNVIHVWMPPLVQGVFRRLEHVIGCLHASGLKMRH